MTYSFHGHHYPISENDVESKLNSQLQPCDDESARDVKRAYKAVADAIHRMWVARYKMYKRIKLLRDKLENPAVQRIALSLCTSRMEALDEPPAPPLATMSFDAAATALKGKAGIYFLWGYEGIEYIGRADCIGRRLRNHDKASPDHRVSAVITTKAESHLTELYYIWKYAPPMNSQSINGGIEAVRSLPKEKVRARLDQFDEIDYYPHRGEGIDYHGVTDHRRWIASMEEMADAIVATVADGKSAGELVADGVNDEFNVLLLQETVRELVELLYKTFGDDDQAVQAVRDASDRAWKLVFCQKLESARVKQ
jgi:hypothetical protein